MRNVPAIYAGARVSEARPRVPEEEAMSLAEALKIVMEKVHWADNYVEIFDGHDDLKAQLTDAYMILVGITDPYGLADREVNFELSNLENFNKPIPVKDKP